MLLYQTNQDLPREIRDRLDASQDLYRAAHNSAIH